MHFSGPIQLPASRPVQAPPERGVAVAVVLLALVLLSTSSWFSQYGVSFALCGEEEPAAVCVLP